MHLNNVKYNKRIKHKKAARKRAAAVEPNIYLL